MPRPRPTAEYHRLTPVQPADPAKPLGLWVFACECGGTVEARAGRVAAGRPKSCGCLAREKSAANGRRSKGVSRPDGRAAGRRASGSARVDPAKLRAARAAAGLTLAALGVACGRGRPSVHRYENGRGQCVPPAIIAAMAAALGVTPADLTA